MPERPNDDDRRRSPRFTCGGHAQIHHLPSDGSALPGKIRDLSLHGCCVDTTLPIDCGARTEIVVRVNATSFRAVGEVRAIRGRSGAGIEFVHLSTGGKDMLADLVGDLAKVQALMNRLKSERREMDAKLLRRELEEGSLRSMRLSERFPFLSTILPADGGEQSQPRKAACANKDAIVEAEPLVIAVDLFG